MALYGVRIKQNVSSGKGLTFTATGQRQYLFYCISCHTPKYNTFTMQMNINWSSAHGKLLDIRTFTYKLSHV